LKRTAICFYGLVGSQSHKGGNGAPLDVSLAGELNLQHIINNNNADVFIHSWSTEKADELSRFYKPKGILVEQQAKFEIPRHIKFSRPLREKIKLLLHPLKLRKTVDSWQKEAFRAYSRWLSCKRSIEQLQKFEKASGFNYDAVLLTRLDVGFITPFDFESYDLTSFWVSNWNNAPKIGTNYSLDFTNQNQHFGFLDFWFLSNSKNIKKFSNLYDNIHKMSVSPHRSSYQYAHQLGFDIKYCKYRWKDFEMVRRRYLDYQE